MAFTWNTWLDGWIIVAGVLCAVASSLVGCLLVLRRMAMLGDAISHAVLPGLAAAFFISNSRSNVWMFLGAVIVGVLTAVLTEWIRGYGKVDEGASMGVVFTTLFALGLVMIVQAADHVDLDAVCVLYGAIETSPIDLWNIGGFLIPRVVVILAGVTLVNLTFVVLFFKELKLSSFDPALATTSGFHATGMHYLLMVLVAVTAVACFESVGNILVLAMMVVPPAAALMLTDRLVRVFILSTVIGSVSAASGHIAAIAVPAWFGMRSTNTAGMMAVAAGVIFFVTVLIAPEKGVIIRWLRQRALALRILREDLLALLYRREERGDQQSISISELQKALLASRIALRLALWFEQRREHIRLQRGAIQLTEPGRAEATRLIRSHRLWEHYLIDTAGAPAARIHDTAERLEHFTGESLRERLNQESDSPQTDPHGRAIPQLTNTEQSETR